MGESRGSSNSIREGTWTPRNLLDGGLRTNCPTNPSHSNPRDTCCEEARGPILWKDLGLSEKPQAPLSPGSSATWARSATCGSEHMWRPCLHCCVPLHSGQGQSSQKHHNPYSDLGAVPSLCFPCNPCLRRNSEQICAHL